MLKLLLSKRLYVLFVASVIALNVLCFLTIGQVNLRRASISQFARRTLRLYNSSYFSSSSGAASKSATSTTAATRSPHTTVDPKTKLKIEKIRQYLNESIPANDAYPAFRIGRYLMSNPDLCRDVEKDVDIIILVHTAPSHLDRRQRMRDSFAKASLYYPFQVRIAFLLGTSRNATLQSQLWLENGAHRDTVMGDFIDDYHNLTLKGVMGYRWVSEHCPNSKYVLKLDDDVLVNMYKLLYSFSGHMHGKKKSIFCNMWSRGTMGILRKGKWKVPDNIFRHLHTFPYDYCSGFLVLISSDLIKPLYEAAKVTPFFWIDDVYLFGMLPNVVGNVTFYNYALNKAITLNDNSAIKCLKEEGVKCSLFATSIGPGKYWSYWKMIQDLYSPTALKIEKTLVE